MIGSAKVSLIVVTSENRIMADRGRIPWNIPEDQKSYRDHIREHIAILGRKTIDDSYTETENIVITSQLDYTPPARAHVVHSVSDALKKAQSLLQGIEIPDQVRDDNLVKDEVFVLGGGEVFNEMIDLADRLYVTIVHEQTGGDTCFPDYSDFSKEISRRDSESGGYRITFLTLERR